MRTKAINQPQGVFRGNNFMTPRILGYFKLAEGYAELSEGEGIYREPIFGVTVRPDDKSNRSKMFHSRTDADAYIEGLS